MLTATLTATLASAAAPAAAHEYWLTPSRGHAAAGDTVRVQAEVGAGFHGEPKPWATTRAVRFVATDARTHDLQRDAVNGAETWATFVAPDAGGIAVAYEGDFARIEMAGAEFDEYLALEGLDGPRRARAESGRSGTPATERYARCPRTWIAGSQPGRVMRPAGLTLELVPVADPCDGPRAIFTLLLRGTPITGARVRAWRQPLDASGAPAARDSVGPAFEGRTDTHGRIAIPAAKPGFWLVSAVHMEPSSAPQDADWQSWWASFTFIRHARGAAR